MTSRSQTNRAVIENCSILIQLERKNGNLEPKDLEKKIKKKPKQVGLSQCGPQTPCLDVRTGTRQTQESFPEHTRSALNLSLGKPGKEHHF